MATQKETTLQIKDFRGINRANDGTVGPPNEFETLTNVHPVNRGELTTNFGAEDKTSIAIPGCLDIKHNDFLRTSFGDEFHLAFCTPTVTAIPTPTTTAVFSTGGGTSTNHNVVISYIGLGMVSSAGVATVAVQANGLTYTLPNDVPSYVAQIDIYLTPNLALGTVSPAGILCGSVHRRNGLFPASIVVPKPVLATLTGSISAQPNAFSATPTTGGNLVGGRTYYVAIAPFVTAPQWSSTWDVTANLSTSAAAAIPMSFQLPVGYTAATLIFGFSAAPAVAAGTNVTKWVVFLGSTPEDLLAVGTTTDGAIVPIDDATIRAGFTVKELSYNSRNGIWMKGDDTRAPTDGGASQDSTATRMVGVYRSQTLGLGTGSVLEYPLGSDVTSVTSPDQQMLAVWASKSFPFTASSSYQLLLHVNERNFCLSTQVLGGFSSAGTVSAPLLGYVTVSGVPIGIHTTQLADRLYGSNGDLTTWYTNGYVLRPIVRVDGGSMIPITNYIGKVKDRLVCGGGANNFANTNNRVFYSEVNGAGLGGPFNFGISPVWNGFQVPSAGTINGFGTFSMDLSASGPSSFLIASKTDKLFTWNGFDGSDSVVSRLDTNTGFNGPKSFTLTKFGGVFVGQDNVYMMRGNSLPTIIGDEVKSIVPLMQDVSVCYHENKVKIGYNTSSSGVSNLELWCELRQEQGSVEKFWSGIHSSTSYNSQAVAPSFGGTKDYRASVYLARIFKRDSTFLDDGSSMSRTIRTNRMGLDRDHFMKILNSLYLAISSSADLTFGITLSMEDGTTSSVSLSAASLSANGVRQLLQKQFSDRYLSRITRITITNTSAGGFSIYDISLLFNVQRRRLIR